MTAEKTPAKPKDQPITCGLVMPISALDGCTAEHWTEVKHIICDAVESIADLKFTVKLVSDEEDVGVIQKRIVQNIYNSDIIVCDVSGKNPNVMFELGMRLAFDKPTVIVKDDKTDYAFDTGIIEHITYPRDLRFARIVAFKMALAEKILATHRAATNNPEHSTFLKNFGKFQVASLSETVVPADKIIIEMLQDLHLEVARLRRNNTTESNPKLRSKIEGVQEIRKALVEYRNQKSLSSLTTADFIKDKSTGIISYLGTSIDGSKYFESQTEFHNAIVRVMNETLRFEDIESASVRSVEALISD